MAGGARAGVVLGTDYSPGTPLTMGPGTTSGPMLVNIVSDNPPNDVMSAWKSTWRSPRSPARPAP